MNIATVTPNVLRQLQNQRRFEIAANFALSSLSAIVIILSLTTLAQGAYATPAPGDAADIYSDQRSDYFRSQLIIGDRSNAQRFDIEDTDTEHSQQREKPISGWALTIDNDILVPTSRDQDYTYGTSLTVAGRKTRDYQLALHRPLSWINNTLGIGDAPVTGHSVEAGLYGFTPEDIGSNRVSDGDRPYASIIYWASTQEIPGASANTAWRSSLTLGLLGLDIVGDLQNEIHELTGSEQARGWQHQISDGGELTARYSLAHQTLWDIGHPNIELKTTAQGSVGYLTEASWGASMRLGRIGSRWQSHNPELTSYGEKTNQSVDDLMAKERYFLLGAAVKLRAYNAFLQGQFRDSDIEYDASELNPAIIEFWAGYSHSLRKGYRVSYMLRGHTSEFERGKADRNVLWGGLTLAKTY